MLGTGMRIDPGARNIRRSPSESFRRPSTDPSVLAPTERRPQSRLLCSRERNVNGIHFTTVIFSYLNGAAEGRPQDRGHSRPLL